MAGQIHRQKKNKDFVTLDTHCLRNPALKWDAKGLHSYLMQLPESWRINIADLETRSKTGREGTSSAMNALVKAGYVYRERVHGKKGKFEGYDYRVFERPEHTIGWLAVNGKTVNGFAVNGKTVTNKDEEVYSTSTLSKDEEISLSLRENENKTVEAQPNLNQPAGRGPGSTVTVNDPELPGVKIVEAGPSTDLPTQRIELNHRPNAETPVQLETKLRAFYIDWPEEWKTGILENGKAKIHPDEKRRDIVKDFCCWAIENNRGGDSFRQLNARLQQWFRNEQYATWKQKSKPAEAGAPSYSIPKNAVY